MQYSQKQNSYWECDKNSISVFTVGEATANSDVLQDILRAAAKVQAYFSMTQENNKAKNQEQ